MEKLKKIYEEYNETAERVQINASPMAGFWGMGEDPKRHHCHDVFYEAVQQWVADFLITRPDSWRVAEAARVILSAAADHRENASYWYAFATQSHVVPMIDYMSAADCKALADWYDTCYTKLERLPAQRNMYKKLRKAAKR